MRKLLRFLIAALVFVASAHAQEFPSKPIRVIVGPGPDLVARKIGRAHV